MDRTLSSKTLQTSKLGIVNATKCYHEVNKLGNANIRTLLQVQGKRK